MKWISVKDEIPKAPGTYFVVAQSADPDKPLYTTAWFMIEEKKFSMIPDAFTTSISHWMKPENPND